MGCKDCVNRPKIDEQYYVDILDAMAERTNRRSHVLNIVLSALAFFMFLAFVISNYLWIKHEQEFEIIEESETVTTDFRQMADDGGNNFIVGGDFNGNTTSYGDENEENEKANP